jgi:predicted aldo/keto reductase-like oxidoreductase
LSNRAILGLWAVALLASLFWIGKFIDETADGIELMQRSLWTFILAVAIVVVAISATLLWARDLGTSSDGGAPAKPVSGRRRFLLGAGGAASGLVATFAAGLIRPRGWLMVTGPAIAPEVPTSDPKSRDEWKGSRIQSYRRLGRTGVNVSDISLGSGHIRGEQGEKLARQLIELGVNYFDTAPDYSEEGSELALGRAMKGHRDKMFLATKFCTPHGHLQAGAPVSKYMEVVEGSLRRLQTDHVDLVHIHACDTLDRLLDPNAHEAFQRLKEQGKVRFLGFSSHTPNLEKIANAAIDDGRFDVMMLAYHHGAWPHLGAIIDRAAEKDVAVVAMKTLKGAKHRGLLEFRPEADTYTQAAFKWVLGNPSVSCLVISFFAPQHVEEYLYASGKTLNDSDLAALRRYDELTAGKHCFQHCGACLDSCPEKLAINDVLRHRMYFEDYGDQKEAMRLYAKLDKKADVCLGCPAPCTNACPEGVAIRERMIGAHEMLRFG